MKKGVKICSFCDYPHFRGNYDKIVKRLGGRK